MASFPIMLFTSLLKLLFTGCIRLTFHGYGYSLNSYIKYLISISVAVLLILILQAAGCFKHLRLHNTLIHPFPLDLEAQAKSSSHDVVKEEGSKVIWEWEGDEGKWNQYDEEHATEITKALTNGEDTVMLQVSPSVKMSIRLSSMTQMNIATGWLRNIRCYSSGCGQWEWEDEHGKWNAYSPVVQQLLVACAECGVCEREIEAGGRKYTVNLLAKKQTNIETNVERKVRVSGESTGQGLFMGIKMVVLTVVSMR